MPIASANFAFLAAHDPLLVRLGGEAERFFADAPDVTLIRLRQLGEALAKQAAALSGVYTHPEDRQIDILQALRNDGVLPQRVSELFHDVRRTGNRAVHDFHGTHRDAAHHLRRARQLAIWFHQTFGTEPDFKAGPFVPPPDPKASDHALREQLDAMRMEMAGLQQQVQAVQQDAAHANALRAEEAQRRAHAEAKAQALYDEVQAAWSLAEESEAVAAAQRAEFEQKLARQQVEAAAAPAEVAEARRERATLYGRAIYETEADTRRSIDAQLRAAGWEADTDALTHAKGVRPAKGRNMAIAEWPTETGPADYVLFIGLMPVGIIEAKRSAKNVGAVIQQAKRYGRGYRLSGDQVSPGGPWKNHCIPFLFSTNGREGYHEQLRDASGIFFLDARSNTNQSRALKSWYSPEGLSKLLDQDIEAADDSLAASPTDYLPLRDYQHAAVRAVETGIRDGQRSLMLAMATGTGKTRTAIALLYRLVKAGRFRRILFLVDRTSLGTQAEDSFQTLKLEQNQSFTDIYDVKSLGDITPESDTRMQIATVQGLVQRVLYSDTPPTVDQYDCIIIDECHRGYNLDREMSESELSFRTQDEYISKYRAVLDHFDAVRVGLTATPALHTKQIFGDPVFTYSYRQAVVDGHLVDHEPAYRIVTELGEDGMRWTSGEQMSMYKVHEDVIVTADTPDDVHIEVEHFNKRVITEAFNRVVCQKLAEHIDPSLPGKTLIFCATDAHADMVVRLLNKAFIDAYGAIDNDAVTKITGAADKPNQQIRHFKNEALPSVVVTVDLLTTGIDVPSIVNLVFIRRVRSRILYEQMVGRATRQCTAIGKSYFRIFDAVGLYSALLPYSSMKPVVVRPNFTVKKLVDELLSLTDETARMHVRDELIAKLRRKIRALQPEQLADFEDRMGVSAIQVTDSLRSDILDDAMAWWTEHPTAATWFDKQRTGDGPVQIISEHKDTFRRIDRGFPEGKVPEDYLESFGEYIRSHINELPALTVVTQRPRDLTRTQLRELKLVLDEAGFTEANLSAAWRATRNQDIAATIIGFIRQQALGSPLVPYDDRVKSAVNQVLTSHAWKPAQREWLVRIGKQLAKETVVDKRALNSGVFKTNGGFKRLNKVFGGELEKVLGDITEAVWEDAG